MLWINAKNVSKFEKALILTKNDFFLSKKAAAHLKYVCIICVKFQTDSSETVEGVDYTKLTSSIGHFLKNL